MSEKKPDWKFFTRLSWIAWGLVVSIIVLSTWMLLNIFIFDLFVWALAWVILGLSIVGNVMMWGLVIYGKWLEKKYDKTWAKKKFNKDDEYTSRIP